MKTTIQETASVALIGPPNSGKSTLLNLLIGTSISVVNRKVHTTRDVIKGIYTENNKQLIFVDTPGFVKNPKFSLEKKIAKKCFKELSHVDIVCIVVTPFEESLNNPLLNENYIQSANPTVVILNKVDLLKNKSDILPIINKLSKRGFQEIFPISALKNQNVLRLKEHFLSKTNAGEWLYDESEITDRGVKQIAEDITLGGLYSFFHNELPYELSVATEMWKECENEIRIYHIIKIHKESHKKILLRLNGELLKKIRLNTTRQIQEFLDKPVTIELFVKKEKQS